MTSVAVEPFFPPHPACDCTSCSLAPPQRPVLGDGCMDGLLIVGEAPGATEVTQGRAFVGESGRLLRKVLAEAGIEPETSCYFTNACLCRPVGNATPNIKAIRACNGRLLDELADVKPTKILAVGASALTAIMGATKMLPITKERGRLRWIEYEGGRALCQASYHPAAILRSPELMRDFRHDIARLLSSDAPEPEPEFTEIVVTSEAEALHYLREMETATLLSCDLETEGLDPWTPPINGSGLPFVISIGFCGVTTFGEYVSVIVPRQIFTDAVLAEVRKLIEGPGEHPVNAFHNASFDLRALDTLFDTPLRPDVFRDTMLENYAKDERAAGSASGDSKRISGPGVHSLKTQARVRYDDSGYAVDIRKFLATPEQDRDYPALWHYQALDTYYTRRMADDLMVEIRASDVDTELLEGLLYPATLALKEIEARGVLLDVPALHRLEVELEAKQQGIEDEVRQVSGKPELNLSSPLQLSRLLYNELGLRRPIRGHKKTTTDTDQAILLELLKRSSTTQQRVLQGILDYRETAIALRTFVRGLLTKMSADGRMRTSFLLHGTITGRLSSQPNLQNLPKPEEDTDDSIGHKIRRCFVAPPGWVLCESDFSQLEIRVAAALSGDKILTDALSADGDIHRQVAAEIFRKPIERVTKLERYVAKRLSFGVLYGQGAKGLLEGEYMTRFGSGWTLGQAEKFVAQHRSAFPELARWIDDTIRQVNAYGVVVTPFGRRRRFAFIPERMRNEAGRQGVNAPIQATASDICLDALIRLHDQLDPELAAIVLTVHDSIVLEVRVKALAEVVAQVKATMEDVPLTTSVPFRVDVAVGPNWGDTKPYA